MYHIVQSNLTGIFVIYFNLSQAFHWPDVVKLFCLNSMDEIKI